MRDSILLMEHDYEVMKYCVRAWLANVHNTVIKANVISDRLKRLESFLDVRGPSLYGRGSKKSQGETMSDNIADLYDLKQSFRDSLDECAIVYKEAMDICDVTYPNRYMVFLHDCEGLTWDKVAREVHYSTGMVLKKAVDGYKDLYQVMPEEWRNVIPKTI